VRRKTQVTPKNFHQNTLNAMHALVFKSNIHNFVIITFTMQQNAVDLTLVAW